MATDEPDDLHTGAGYWRRLRDLDALRFVLRGYMRRLGLEGLRPCGRLRARPERLTPLARLWLAEEEDAERR